MRISDWSSDVCSSDLCLHHQQGVGRWNIVVEQAVDQQQVALEVVGVVLVGLVVVVAAAVLRDHRQALPLLGPVVLVAAVVVVAAFGDADLERSEEHTSELQSLMRLSYAVFCLKQKK